MLRSILFALTYFLCLIPLHAQTPVLVKDINPGSAGSGYFSRTRNYDYRRFVSANGVVFFCAIDDVHGWELWRSDGTEAGTYLTKDINPGSKDSFPFNFNQEDHEVALAGGNGIAYFSANDDVHGFELWRSDGTTAGTYMVKDINPKNKYTDTDPNALAGASIDATNAINGILYFSGNDGTHGWELWRSDGTEAGTYMVKDINTTVSPYDKYNGNGSSYYGGIAEANGLIYFWADDGSHGVELWRTNGTEAGTYMIKDTNPGSNSAYIYSGYINAVTTINGIIYFIATDGIHGYELWRTDGTAAGTYMVKDINPGNDGPLISKPVNLNGIGYFGVSDGTHGYELWRTDGTVIGTYLVKDFSQVNLAYLNLYYFKGALYFNASDSEHGIELWCTDGTAAGTYLVKDINPGTANSVFRGNYLFTELNGVLYFGAYDGKHGHNLWRTDGTEAGTYIVDDNSPYSADSAFFRIVVSNGSLLFGASDATHGFELWKMDGISTQHFHQLAQNPFFQTRKLLAEGTNFKVCADGSEASVFKVSGGGKDYSQAIVRIPGTDATQTGSFSVIQPNRDSLVVRYTHPDYIQTLGSSVTLVAGVYATPGSTTPITTFDITVYRASVLMVHGLWSGSESFAKMENELVSSLLYPSIPKSIRRADYSTTNSLAFAANVPKIKTEAELLIKSVRDAGVAAGNVDYIGHSMGGILGRLYLQGDTYQCGFHKLITVNTPHSGSQLANLLTKGTNALPKPAGMLCRDLIPMLSYATGDACGSGAIDNLRVDSPEITSTLNGIRRNYRTVPSHAIATVDYQTVKEIKDTFFGEGEPVQKPDGSYDATRIPKKITKALRTANEAKDVIALADIPAHLLLDIGGSALFDGPNDYVVSLISQQGGMTGNCTTTIENQAHTGSPENDRVIDRVKTLLVAAPSSASFCQYFDPININKSAPPLIIPNGTIVVTSPKVGLRLQPGAQGVLNGNGTDLTEIRAVIEYSSTEILTVKSTGNTIVCNFPVGNETGLKRVVITGKTSSGGYVSDTTSFYVGGGIPIGQCESVQSGDWVSSATWSCGHEPTINDIVVINPGHVVTVSTSTAQAKRINNSGKLLFPTTNSKVFLKEND